MADIPPPPPDRAALLFSTIARGPTAAAAAVAARPRTVATTRALLLACDDLGARLVRAVPRGVVHVAGSKGKGSTCALAERVLRRHGGLRTGLFTSPHLVDVRERIRVDGKPVSREAYAAAFDAVWARVGEAPGLGYFKLLLLVALEAFVAAGVDVAVLEVGMGGLHDATNAVPDACVGVSGVTLLELEHTAILGGTLELIAAEKSGIFRPGVPAVVARQPSPAALAVVRARAAAAGAPLTDAAPLAAADAAAGLPGGEPAAAAENLALALALAAAVLDGRGAAAAAAAARARAPLDAGVLRALAGHAFPGRCHAVARPGNAGARFFVDGAHTLQSVAACARWFSAVAAAGPSAPAALVFACGHEKDPAVLLRALAAHAPPFALAVFCAPKAARPSASAVPTTAEAMARAGVAWSGTPAGVPWHATLAALWAALVPGGGEVRVVGSAAAAVAEVDAWAAGAAGGASSSRVDAPRCLATGSLYLCGDVLTALGWDPDEGAG